jgi:hypothetical protein
VAKRADTRIKLPADVIGTLKVLLNTPPLPAREKAKAKRKKARKTNGPKR